MDEPDVLVVFGTASLSFAQARAAFLARYLEDLRRLTNACHTVSHRTSANRLSTFMV